MLNLIQINFIFSKFIYTEIRKKFKSIDKYQTKRHSTRFKQQLSKSVDI